MGQTTLPPTFTEFLREALQDAPGVNREDYVPDCTVWHVPGADGTGCRACLAGLALTTRVEIPTHRHMSPQVLDDLRLKQALQALEQLRNGAIVPAIRTCHDEVPTGTPFHARGLPECDFARLSEFRSWEEFEAFVRGVREEMPCIERYGREWLEHRKARNTRATQGET